MHIDEKRGNDYRNNKSDKSQGTGNNTSRSIADLHGSDKGKFINPNAILLEPKILIKENENENNHSKRYRKCIG